MFRLSIVTTEGPVFEDAVASIIAPGALGYLGLQTNHAPLMTTLTPGKLTISRDQTSKITLMIGEGFLENSWDPEKSANRCLIVTRSIEFASKQDYDQATAYREAAENRLRQPGSAGKDYDISPTMIEKIDRLIKTAGRKIIEKRD